MFPRSRLPVPQWFPLWAVPLVGLAVLGAIASSFGADDRWVREEGGKACLASGVEAEACEAAIDEHHRTCMNYTFTRAGRHGAPRRLDLDGYVECVVSGPAAYRAASQARRAAELRAGGNAGALR